MKLIILTIRFLLEVITVAGIVSGFYLKNWNILYLMLAASVIVVWSRYGAPGSANAFVGVNKFLLELIIFGIGIFIFYQLFGKQVGMIYMVMAIMDLIFMYIFRLE